MRNICIPSGAKAVISILEQSGFEAYVVGGCVRDSLLGLEPKDWDICTSATPDDMLRICAIHGVKVIETGLKHGTLTICWLGERYEVTTFRIDGEYSDSRHPDNVTFTSSLQADLARRDFSMNAMAYNNHVGLVDPFCGTKALCSHEISCVGDPADRLQEDALRVMRALRFASTYGFSIEENTDKAIRQFAPHLNDIAVERIRTELCKLLFGKGALEILLGYSDIISAIIPEIAPCIGFDQKNRYHQYDIYEHIAHAVSNYTGSDLSVKIALLLHDIGKPCCYTEDENGGHFYGHGVHSRDIAEEVLNRLRFDNDTKREVLELVLYHDSVIEPTPKVVRRWLNKIGEKRFRQLLCVRMADIKAHAEGTQNSRIERCNALKVILDEIISQEQCFSLKDLAINGDNIMFLGIQQGKMVGEILHHVLNLVINGDISNEADVLTEEAQRYIKEEQES